MISSKILLVASLLPFSQSAETILGVYLLVRHGDRTSKEAPPTGLTNLGYQEIHDTGDYFHNRYVNSTSNSNTVIKGVNGTIVKQSQISTTAPPYDNVLMNSAQGFLQGLYPPEPHSETLRDGRIIPAPLDGYQLIPVEATTAGVTSPEDSPWLQGQSSCANAVISSNSYFSTSEYKSLLASTSDFYKRLDPVISGAYTGDDQSFKNAYGIFDYINVALIHNKTIPSDKLLDQDTLLQLQYLANVHEYNLAYNSSDSIRAVAGSTIAADIVKSLNKTITSKGNLKMSVQFNAYGAFLSLFGLAQLDKVDPKFSGIVDYASVMSFELFTDGPTDPFPSPDALNVRFLFNNGTSNNTHPPQPYPLFGQNQNNISWNSFVSEMNKFALIGESQAWCKACGNSTGVCSVANSTSAPGSTSSKPGSSCSSDGGISKAVAGVIGAFVTLAVILGLFALVILVGGMRLVSKKALGHNHRAGNGEVMSKAS